MAHDCCLAAGASTAPTLKPHPGASYRDRGPLRRGARGSGTNPPLLLAGEKRGKTRLGMAEKFGGWFKGNRLSCLQPAEAASSPRWRRPAALAEN